MLKLYTRQTDTTNANTLLSLRLTKVILVEYPAIVRGYWQNFLFHCYGAAVALLKVNLFLLMFIG